METSEKIAVQLDVGRLESWRNLGKLLDGESGHIKGKSFLRLIPQGRVKSIILHLDMDLLNLRFALDIWKKMRRKKVININLKLKEIWAGDEEVCAISFRWGLSQNTLLIITRLVRGVQESKSGNKQKITTINECLQNRIKMKFSGESTKRKCCQWNKIYEIL